MVMGSRGRRGLKGEEARTGRLASGRRMGLVVFRGAWRVDCRTWIVEQWVFFLVKLAPILTSVRAHL